MDATTITITSEDPLGETARKLVAELCAEMASRYGTAPSPFSLAEAAAPRTVFLVARLGDDPVGCGALRRFDDETAEIKRMYVAPAGRRRGLARRILAALERHAHDFHYHAIRLETGVRQPEAQAFYESVGFRRIAAFGPYIGNPTSVCFEKTLTARTPEAVVQDQLDAYNAKDLDALMATYAEEAQQFEYPATLLASGRTQIRERFAARFQEPGLHAELLRRITLGNVVIDHERVSQTFLEGAGAVELVAIYEVRDQKIVRATFVRGPKTMNAL